MKNNSDKYFFIVLGMLYVLYFLIFVSLGGFNKFFSLWNWGIFLKIFLLLFPLYIAVIIKAKDKLTALDKKTVYVPVFYWLLFNFLVGYKGAANFLVELSIVGILSGAYLIKIPLSKHFKNQYMLTSILWIVICVLITATHFIMPYLPE
ncbi:MAG: hypothetical protein ABII88_07570 [Candidatus Omnitrophota bacterium]